MRRLLVDPASRFVTTTAAIGSLADWTLFALLVVTVDAATAGSPWATSLVLAAKIVPAIVFAPIAARRVDRMQLDRALLAHELLRIVAVCVIAAGALRGEVVVGIVGIVAFEYAAAVLGATRESFISRHVPRGLFTPVNTVTAVLGYGLLPVGAAIVHQGGLSAGWVVVAAGYGTLAYRYARLKVPEETPQMPSAISVDGPTTSGGRGLLRTVLAAGAGIVPVVALFTVAPRLAESWLGQPTATGWLTGLVFVGGAAGFVAANRNVPAEVGLVTASIGLLVAANGGWQVGLVAVGFGAGTAYLGLQTRLQHLAGDPSQFAAAFALLKGCAAAATFAGPAVFAASGGNGLLLFGAVIAAVSAVVAVGPRRIVQEAIRAVVVLAVRIRVEGTRTAGPAVVVSNHPNALDGVVVKAVDRSLRPVARWQRHPLARLGIWIGDCVVTTARTGRSHRPAYEEAVAHLQAGGRIWLAPEGGAHPDRDLRPPRTGAVRMAHAAQVPVQTLGIVHERHPGPRLAEWRPWRRPTVTLRWGGSLRTHGNIETDNDRMMSALAAASGMRWTSAEEVAA